jgi:hypothetical protein
MQVEVCTMISSNIRGGSGSGDGDGVDRRDRNCVSKEMRS